jgi:hypothetical protein|tara:strand:+ start:176 stop:571 length:396 start_codon:yes stop_codon:yes gene_type:complete
MDEIAIYEHTVFAVLGFTVGLFTSIFLSRLLGVIHAWRLVEDTVAHLLWMCAKIEEEVSFLQELKDKHMRESDFTPEQIRKFNEIDHRTLTNWKESVILSIVKRAPRHFQSMLPFTSWDEAIQFMNNTLKR